MGNRHKNRKTILWVIGGDYLPPAGSEGETRLHKFMEGVKAANARELWAGDWHAPGISTDEPAFASSMDLNAVYTSGSAAHSGPTYVEARTPPKYSRPRPPYLTHPGQVNEHWLPA